MYNILKCFWAAPVLCPPYPPRSRRSSFSAAAAALRPWFRRCALVRSSVAYIGGNILLFSYFSVYQTTRKIRTVHKGRKVNSSGIKGVTQFARKRKSPDKFQISLHLSGLSFAQPAHSTRFANLLFDGMKKGQTSRPDQQK